MSGRDFTTDTKEIPPTWKQFGILNISSVFFCKGKLLDYLM